MLITQLRSQSPTPDWNFSFSSRFISRFSLQLHRDRVTAFLLLFFFQAKLEYVKVIIGPLRIILFFPKKYIYDIIY